MLLTVKDLCDHMNAVAEFLHLAVRTVRVQNVTKFGLSLNVLRIRPLSDI